MLDQQLVCFYLDDSGQQSQGRFLVIAGLAVDGERRAIASALCNAEEKSGKHLRDWHTTATKRRVAYLEEVCNLPYVRNRIFYKVFRNCPSNHMQLRGDGVQDAIAYFAAKKQRAVYYEGLTRATQDSLKYDLKRRGLRAEMRNARFAHVPEVRLADALAGMIAKVRFSTDGAQYESLFCDWFVEV